MLTDSNKLFWTRAGLAVVAGLISGIMNFSDETAQFGVLLIVWVYLISYYIGKNLIFGGKEVGTSTLITTGLGTYIMLSLFTWILYHTLHVANFI
ncbi:MAG: hypothetical protein ACUVQ8_01835 [Nitrososphaeria archaeon]